MFPKIILLVYVSSCLTLSYAQGYKKLTVQDFKGNPDINSPYISNIKLKIGYHSTIIKKKDKYHASFRVYLGVDSLRSWIKFSEVKDEAKLKSVLNHEQGHLKIGVLMQHELTDRLRTRSYTVHYKQEAAGIFNKVARKYQAMQEQYDQETQHMMHRQEQRRWDEKLDKMLRHMK